MPGPERYLGQRLSFDGALCTLRYVGPIGGTKGDWLGVEWDEPSRGKHDGSHNGVRYFECRYGINKDIFPNDFSQLFLFTNAHLSLSAAANSHLHRLIRYTSQVVALLSLQRPSFALLDPVINPSAFSKP